MKQAKIINGKETFSRPYYETFSDKANNRGKHYTASEIEFINKKIHPDSSYALMLGRTIAGIERVRVVNKDSVGYKSKLKTWNKAKTFISEIDLQEQMEEGEE